MTAKHSIDQQIDEVIRELGLRKSVYPHQVARQKMTQEKADEHMARMESVLATLKWLQGKNETAIEDLLKKARAL